MFLRRINEHVRTQNWIAVFLDFTIVVTGILIAFQITNWNEARQDRRDEQRYLAELAVNLEADLVQARRDRKHRCNAFLRPKTFWPRLRQTIGGRHS